MIKHYCSYCGSEDVNIPLEQATTIILFKCLRCGALMSSNSRYIPDLWKLNPQTGTYEGVKNDRQD